MQQEEIYLRIRDEDQETETTELIPTAIPDHAAAPDNQEELQGETKCQLKKNPESSLLMFSVIEFYRLCN